jgi:DNA repair protein RadD
VAVRPGDGGGPRQEETSVTLTLRSYQEIAVESVYRHLRQRDDNPVVVVPTGGGKTPIIARICHDAVVKWSGRVVILAHVKELLEQSYKHLERDVQGAFPIGIYSAGLGSRDTGYPVTIAGIQSAFRNVDDFQPADLILVDEAHRIPPDGEGQYRTFLDGMKRKNPNVRLIGFTATPYRTSTGAICAKENLLNRICFEVGVRELIMNGYLSPLVTRGGQVDTDFSGISVKRGEFDQNQLETLMSEDIKVATAISDIFHRAKDRKKILIFASGVDHGRKIVEFLKSEPEDAGSVGQIYGETPADERADLVKRFRDGDLRILVNVDVLTLGFDAPNVDCVALMRATMSPGLYYQMVGRGFRIAPGKKDTLVLDFGDNVVRHGPVDVLAPISKSGGGDGDGRPPAKKCPECCLIVMAGSSACPECGYQFPKPEARHQANSYAGSVVSEDQECPVLAIDYSAYVKKKDDGTTSRTLKVEYLISDLGIRVSEWVCLEHSGWARDKAVGWWTRRAGSGPAPKTIDEALAHVHELARPTSLKVGFGGRYPEILKYTFTTQAVPENQPF